MATLFKRHVVLQPSSQPAEPTISELFHENTKLHPDVTLGSSVPGRYSHAEHRAMTRLGRRYERATKVPLTPAAALPRAELSLEQAIVGRRTRREFGTAPLSEQALSKLLFLSAGVTGEQPAPDGTTRQLRAAPSGGALYPVELYVAVCRVDCVPQGLYHYAPREHCLELCAEGDPMPALRSACHYHESLTGASVVVLFSGVLERTKRKYGERGYRLVLLEAGHVAQNLSLAASALGLGSMNVCGFFDDRINSLLQIDGVEEAALYAAYVGTMSTSQDGAST
jgi:SagB-type dehydrogenase family enzyme